MLATLFILCPIKFNLVEVPPDPIIFDPDLPFSILLSSFAEYSLVKLEKLCVVTSCKILTWSFVKLVSYLIVVSTKLTNLSK